MPPTTAKARRRPKYPTFEEVGFPIGLVRMLDVHGVTSVGQLTRFTADGLRAKRGMGAMYLRTIRYALARHGLALRNDEAHLR